VERSERRERLCARVRERRSVARREAVTSAEGGSPKMKNFMNAPRRRTMESWPMRRPWVKESLGIVSLAWLDAMEELTRTRSWEEVVRHPALPLIIGSVPSPKIRRRVLDVVE
jgi:hypothetical protein